MRILVSGASIAGPVLAFWLARYGFAVTVVERAPALHKTGGHAVDLFRPAMEISAQMGVQPRIEALATGTTRLAIYREGHQRPLRVDLGKIYRAASDRHVEIMRDDLSEIYYETTQHDVEYLFGDSISSISPAGDVSFEHGATRRFDAVVGADGLHSNVRRLMFGDETRFTRFLGAYLAVASVPKMLALEREMSCHVAVGRGAALYTAEHLDDARLVFLFRSAELRYAHGDTPQQKEILRHAFAGMDPQVQSWLEQLDAASTFYFDSITQLELDEWSRGRVTLVGDAGYCPGPAVGGSTSLAVVGAYVLAGELARADGDLTHAFAAYERQMREPVRQSRAFARGAAKTIVPGTRTAVWALTRGAQLVSLLPTPLTRAAAKLNTRGVRLHDSIPLPSYAALRTDRG